ncbi:MAG: hypothetical protein M1401_16940 [Chloroflexi bacterium]|nr:hypothetical protein [Chloroflexota bacterium]
MTTYLPPLCLWCKHYHKSRERPHTCDAFLDEIPDDIFFTSQIDHRHPVDGDGGIQFESDPDNPIPPVLLKAFEQTPRWISRTVWVGERD